MERKTAEKIISLIDLTSLNTHDDQKAIKQLCQKAMTIYGPVAAVCILPSFVKYASSLSPVTVATVVNFPTGRADLAEVLVSISQAIKDGAKEIDVVFPFYDSAPEIFLRECKKICGKNVLLKVILETGSAKTPEEIAQRCQIALAAGADFLKTSTGKVPIGATLEAAEILLKAIKMSGKNVGFKASGGIREIEQAEEYLKLADKIMGPHWVSPTTFRLGASQLLDTICKTSVSS